VRKLLKARRAPVTLDELADAAPSPRVLLAALAAAVDPAWTEGHRFGVRYELEDDPAASVTVIAEDGRPLRVVDAGDAERAATVTLSATELRKLLAGSATGAKVTGDGRAVKALHTWFDRARGASEA
ncbi:MAG TPA: hypothetical protein VN238_11830, partial [Solirubrobacteraceae bacterium]|nr:hypothetical protein [Solirubrobacteraceae bacterium]